MPTFEEAYAMAFPDKPLASVAATPTARPAPPLSLISSPVSKREWLSVKANHDLFVKHLNKNNNKGSTVETNANVS